MKTLLNYIKESYSVNEASLKKLMDEDSDYMGGLASYYISKSSCSRSEYAEAGKQWAQDELDAGNISEDEYEEAINHYDNF